MTEKQRQLLSFIERFQASHGSAPSFEEMKDALGLRSKSGVHRLVSALAEAGHISRARYRARRIDVVRHFCPHCGEPLDAPPRAQVAA